MATPELKTAPEVDPGPELAGLLQYHSGTGRVLVAKSQQANPYVRGFIARLQRLGLDPVVVPVELSELSRQVAADASRNPATQTQMQRDAMALFQRAVDAHASDIHIRVKRNGTTHILLRVHNDLEPHAEHPAEYGEMLCSAIYQAMADVSDATFEQLSRQDARISDRAKLASGLDGIRIATTPQVDGFAMVLRLLYHDTGSALGLENLGYSAEQVRTLDRLKARPGGINIIGGPTGSGKSTTLQRVLAAILRECEGRRHVITVEDPPEYPIPGAVQTPVTNVETEEERSRAFQSAIKAAMRLDPDIIMIGEIRDAPSAKLSLQASMTGHQVWSTLHVNGAFAVPDRLMDLGVARDLLGDPGILGGMICQRLTKVLCPHCKIPLRAANVSTGEVERIYRALGTDEAFVRGPGCSHCGGKGIVGRTVVAEVVEMDETLAELVLSRKRRDALAYWRKSQGGILMAEHAVLKARAGLIDPFQAEEVVGRLPGPPTSNAGGQDA